MSDRDQAAIKREIAARRRAQAFQMRREGASYEAIGSRIGVTRQAAHKMVAREVRLLAAETDPEERRILHAEALMDLWQAFYGPASEGDAAAADRFLRVEERLANLLGLDLRPEASAEPDRAVQIVVGSPDEASADGVSRPRRFRRSSDAGEQLGAYAEDAESA